MKEAQAEQSAPYHKGDSQLRSWLINYIREHPQHTTVVLARAAYVGISRKASTLTLPALTFCRKRLAAWVPTQANPESNQPLQLSATASNKGAAPRSPGAFLKPAHGSRWSELEAAILENRIVLVYGRAGIGKSRCLAEYALSADGGAAARHSLLNVSVN